MYIYKKEVFKIVRRGREFGTPGYFARAFFYIGLFFTMQYYWVTSVTTYTMAVIYGVNISLIESGVDKLNAADAVLKLKLSVVPLDSSSFTWLNFIGFPDVGSAI